MSILDSLARILELADNIKRDAAQETKDKSGLASVMAAVFEQGAYVIQPRQNYDDFIRQARIAGKKTDPLDYAGAVNEDGLPV